MYAVFSELDAEHRAKINDHWSQSQANCAPSGAPAVPVPHFTWWLAEEADRDLLKRAVQGLAQSLLPFEIKTSGIGLFTHPDPTIYIPIVRNSRLLLLHETIWEHCRPASKRSVPYYAPENWLPHITIAQPIEPGTIDCLLPLLLARPWQWIIQITTQTLAYHPPGQAVEIVERYELANHSGPQQV